MTIINSFRYFVENSELAIKIYYEYFQLEKFVRK